MGKFVLPKTFMLGYSEVNMAGLKEYLEYTKQTDFLTSLTEAMEAGVSAAECLISFYAKLCYKSLVIGKNSNLKRVRDIPDNIASIITTAHMSVFEHVSMNFVVTDCSRVYTHEQVRHRQGTNDSQTSGRYCRLDSIDLVFDPILEPARDLWEEHLGLTEELVYLTECRLGLRKPNPEYPDAKPEKCLPRGNLNGYGSPAEAWVPDDQFDFTKRKQITSAIRRIAPNGQANEMGMTLNVRALRHTILLRTQRFAEWEIRVIFAQIFELVQAKFPLLFKDARVRTVAGLPEVYGLKRQPHDLDANSPAAMQLFTDAQVLDEFKRRHLAA